MSGATRRQLLGRGAALSAASALPAGLLAAPALAQADEQTDALERLIELEHAAQLAYSITEQDDALSGELAKLGAVFRALESDHAEALSSAIDQLGVDPPESSDDPATYDSLKGLDAAKSARARLDLLIELEEGLVSAYEEETANLEAVDLFRTAAQVAASHAQHLVSLRLARGDEADAAVKLPPASSPATASEPAAASAESGE